MEWRASEDAATTEGIAAEFIAARLAQAISARGSTMLALSGGETPWGMFERLAAQPVHWNGVHLFQVDERIVPRDHQARNLKRLLASPLARCVPSANLHAMPVELDDAEEAASQYAIDLIACAGNPPLLDVVHLGLGADGHTASLVAGDPVLEESCRWVGVSRRYENYRRLTLTLPTLSLARCVVWFVLGAARREAMSRLLAGDLTVPASRVRRDQAICFSDRAAAPSVPAG
jgi:6-phosphogluconolactonase